jgi:hypothetical protein
MLDKNPSLVEAVNVMLQGAVVESTSLQYGAVVREFRQFCVAKKKVFPHFTESTVLEFVAISFSRGRPLGLFRTLLAALAMIEKVTGRGASAITDQVWSAVYSVQRHLEHRKPARKKARPLDCVVVNRLIGLEIFPYVCRPYSIDPIHFRSLFWARMIYFTI